MPYRCAFLLFLLFSGPIVFAQNMGVIQCKPGATAPVPAFAVPGKPFLVTQLTCGQIVRIIGLDRPFSPLYYSGTPREYMIIQLGSTSAYVDPQFVRRLNPGETPEVNKVEKPTVPKESTPQDEEQNKWIPVTKDSLKIRDEVLLNPIILNGSTYLRSFRAMVTNTSSLPISHLRLQVRIYDCAGKARSDYSNCEIVSEANSIAATSVPAGQTRSVEVPATFDTVPHVSGTMAWSYQILGVQPE